MKITVAEATEKALQAILSDFKAQAIAKANPEDKFVLWACYPVWDALVAAFDIMQDHSLDEFAKVSREATRNYVEVTYRHLKGHYYKAQRIETPRSDFSPTRSKTVLDIAHRAYKILAQED